MWGGEGAAGIWSRTWECALPAYPGSLGLRGGQHPPPVGPAVCFPSKGPWTPALRRCCQEPGAVPVLWLKAWRELCFWPHSQVWLCQAHSVDPKAVKWLGQLQSEAECVFLLCFPWKEPPSFWGKRLVVCAHKPPAILGLQGAELIPGLCKHEVAFQCPSHLLLRETMQWWEDDYPLVYFILSVP